MQILTKTAFLNREIPSPDDFCPVLNAFEQECVFPFLGNEVLGSFAYGSANRDDCTVAREYVDLLGQQAQNKIPYPNQSSVYDESVQKIWRCYGEAVHFIEQNALHMKAEQEKRSKK